MRSVLLVALVVAVVGCESQSAFHEDGEVDVVADSVDVAVDELLDTLPDSSLPDTNSDTSTDAVVDDILDECDYGRIRCAGECIDPMSSEQYCGDCFTSCPLQALCEWGECVCQPTGTVLCDGACVELGTDVNCSECGDSCDTAIGESCRDGVCQCADGWMLCDGECRNVQLHDRYCGDCETVCPNGWDCQGGTCECLGDWCSGVCVNLMTNHGNCDTCSRQCDSDEVCSGGICQGHCSAPYFLCNFACHDVWTSDLHCGTCGHTCDGDERCESGACVAK
jgi:hypothetical protein